MAGFGDTFLQAIRRINPHTRPRRSLDDRLAEIARDLTNIRDIQELMRMPGWEKLMGELRRNRDELQIRVNQLVTASPAKNDDELRALNALREAIDLLVGIFNSTLAAEKPLMKRRADLEEAQRQQAESQRQFG